MRRRHGVVLLRHEVPAVVRREVERLNAGVDPQRPRFFARQLLRLRRHHYPVAQRALIHDDVPRLGHRIQSVALPPLALGLPRGARSVPDRVREVARQVLDHFARRGHVRHEGRVGGAGQRPWLLADRLVVRRGGDGEAAALGRVRVVQHVQAANGGSVSEILQRVAERGRQRVCARAQCDVVALGRNRPTVAAQRGFVSVHSVRERHLRL
mmetsp:Transcript_48376/g.149331  ORF Transcript_48376/g.149331 Transcript_48376/m.149331 type:complete len:211 (-) Transcript_48376:885-1517(-)